MRNCHSARGNCDYRKWSALLSRTVQERKRRETQQYRSSEKGGLKVDNTIGLWLADKDSNTYDDMVFVPQAPETKLPANREIIDDGRRCFNLWPGWPVEPQKGDTGPYERQADRLFGKQD